MTNVQVKCPQCGANSFEASTTNPQGNDRLVCTKCGFSGTRNGIIAPNIADAKKAISDALKKRFK